MGTMKFEVPHSLPKDEVRKRVEQLLRYWDSRHGVKATWQSDGARVVGKVMGIALDAQFTITDSAVQGEGTDPGLLLRSQAKSYLQKKLGEALDPSKSADDLKLA
jgi:hypothetical protein